MLKPPIDAIAEFKILTSTANAEFGGAAGSTTNEDPKAKNKSQFDVHSMAVSSTSSGSDWPNETVACLRWPPH